jgi:hypothetical protein
MFAGFIPHLTLVQVLLTAQNACFATHGLNPLNPLDPLNSQKIRELSGADWRADWTFPADQNAIERAGDREQLTGYSSQNQPPSDR